MRRTTPTTIRIFFSPFDARPVSFFFLVDGALAFPFFSVPVDSRSTTGLKPLFGRLGRMRLLLFSVLGILLLCGMPFALSFSSFAFLFPQVSHPLGLGSCAAFSQGVTLSGRAVQESGFESGVLHAQRAVQLLGSARRLSQFQDSPVFWVGANPALYQTVSVLCHRLAAQALEEAVSSVALNWNAVDRCIASVEYAGVQLDGPGRGLYLEWDAQRQRVENRTAGTGLGGRLVEALDAVTRTERDDAAFVQGVQALAGPLGVLEWQVQACRDAQRVLSQQERDVARLEDELEQRLQDGQRLEARLEQEKISLIPQHAFALQTQATFSRTGWVQSFPEALQSARQAGLDARETLQKGQRQWKQKDAGFAERALTYFYAAREEAERAVVSWQAIDHKTQQLESDLLRQVDQLRHTVRTASAHDAAGSLDEALAWQNALALSDRPLPASRGERILQLADAVRALSGALAPARPAATDAVRVGVDALAALLAVASQDGLDVSFERGQLQNVDRLAQGISPVQAAAQLEDLRESVVQKARARFGRLDADVEELTPFRAFVSVPGDGTSLVIESNIGQLTDLEKQLEAAQTRVRQGRMRWLSDHLNQQLQLVIGSDPVEADVPARRPFHISVTNGLLFGSDGPVLLPRPQALPDGAKFSDGADFRLLPDGLLFPRVDAGAAYKADGTLEDVLVRTRSVREQTRYATLAVARQSWTITLDSQIEASVFWQRSLAYPVAQAVLDDGEVRPDADGIRLVLPAVKKGFNVFHLEFDVPQPVRADKHIDASGWTYSLESKVPFDVSFPWVLDETVACVPSSRDVGIASLSPGMYRFSANVTLHAFEKRSWAVQLGCVIESLRNQTALLERVPGLSDGSDAVLSQVRDALDSGRLTDAAWLLFRLQQPESARDPLEPYRTLSHDGPQAQRLLERADAAFMRGDSATLTLTIKELDAYVKSQKSALEEQAKAVCSRCPPEVESGLHEAKSALFLGDLNQAREKISTARQQYVSWMEDEAQRNRTTYDLAAQIQAQAWPASERFLAAWDVPESAMRWRGRQSLYGDAKTRHDRLQSAIKTLDDVGRKVLDGKAVAAAGVQADLDSARSDHAALESLLERLDLDARAAVQTTEKAFAQFGTPSQQPALDAIRRALEEGRIAAAWYSAEQLSASLAQRSTASSPSTATGLLGSHSFLEVGAGVGGLLVLAGLAFWFKRQQKEAPLEEIG